MPNWKIAVFVGWAVVALALLTAPDSQMIGYARIGFWLTLAAHVVEFGIFYKTLDQAPGPIGRHFAFTLALGMFHIQEVRTAADTKDA